MKYQIVLSDDESIALEMQRRILKTTGIVQLDDVIECKGANDLISHYRQKSERKIEDILITDVNKHDGTIFDFFEFLKEAYDTTDFHVVIITAMGDYLFRNDALFDKYPFIKAIFLKPVYHKRVAKYISAILERPESSVLCSGSGQIPPKLNITTLFVFDLINISPELELKLSGIKTLCVSGSNDQNVITRLIKKCENLERILLFGEVLEVPSDILSLKKLKDFDFSPYQIGYPPKEVTVQGVTAMFRFLESCLEGTVMMGDYKVFFIGNGGAGKTSIIDRILGFKFKEISKKDRTRQIHINKIKINDEITLHLWDFAGQTIYHSTHRAFFDNTSIIVIVIAPDTDNYMPTGNFNIAYWLNLSRVDRSWEENRRIILVQNKADLYKKFAIQNLNKIYKNFQVYGNIVMSAKTGEGIEALFSMIKDSANQLTEPRFLVPKKWFELKEHLITLSEKQKTILYADFQLIANGFELSDKDAQILINFLHEYGIIFYKESLFENRIILDQEWMLTLVYSIINNEILSDEYRGIIPRKDLYELLVKLTIDEIDLIVSVLKKSELLFDYNDNDRDYFIIPMLLPSTSNVVDLAWTPDITIQYQLEGDFLSNSLIHSIISRAGKFSRKHFWNSGLLIDDLVFETKALIKYEKLASKIIVQVVGKRRIEWLFTFRATILQMIGFTGDISESLSFDGENQITLKSILNDKLKGGRFLETLNGELIDIEDVIEYLHKEDTEFLGLTSFLQMEKALALKSICANGDLNKAFSEAIEFCQTFQNPYVNKFILLKSSFNRIVKDHNLGLVNDPDVRFTQLTLSFLTLIDEIISDFR